MSFVCEICGKSSSFGNRVARLGKKATKRRVHGRSRRQFKPNIKLVRAVIDGRVKRVKACTSCIKAGRVQKPPQRPPH